MIGTPDRNGAGYLALLLVDRLIQHLKEADLLDQAEVSAWVDELKQFLASEPYYVTKQAALDQLNSSRIGH